MKKLLALVLSLLMVASSFALTAIAAEETTEENTYVDGTTAEETTEEEKPEFSPTVLTFNDDARSMKVLTSPTGIAKAIFSTSTSSEQWEGARLAITDIGDPYVTINWSTYTKKTGVDKIEIQNYPYVVFKLKVDGYLSDIELFYAAGSITAATGGYSTNTDIFCDCTGEVEYIMYDLSDDDCEGRLNNFRFDPVEPDEDTVIYLYEMAFFATEEEALAYAGYDETEEETTEEPEETQEETEAPKQEESEIQTAAPVTGDDEKGGCGSVISVGAVLVSIISLGAVCIKKKD